MFVEDLTGAAFKHYANGEICMGGSKQLNQKYIIISYAHFKLPKSKSAAVGSLQFLPRQSFPKEATAGRM
jgi:hypothetical protein